MRGRKNGVVAILLSLDVVAFSAGQHTRCSIGRGGTESPECPGRQKEFLKRIGCVASLLHQTILAIEKHHGMAVQRREDFDALRRKR